MCTTEENVDLHVSSAAAEKITVTQTFGKLEVEDKESTNSSVEKANLTLIRQKTGESLIEFVN